MLQPTTYNKNEIEKDFSELNKWILSEVFSSNYGCATLGNIRDFFFKLQASYISTLSDLIKHEILGYESFEQYRIELPNDGGFRLDVEIENRDLRLRIDDVCKGIANQSLPFLPKHFWLISKNKGEAKTKFVFLIHNQTL